MTGAATDANPSKLGSHRHAKPSAPASVMSAADVQGTQRRSHSGERRRDAAAQAKRTAAHVRSKTLRRGYVPG